MINPNLVVFIQENPVRMIFNNCVLQFCYILGYMRNELTHCGLLTASWNLVDIASGNGLLPDSTKALPQPILMSINYVKDPVTFLLG